MITKRTPPATLREKLSFLLYRNRQYWEGAYRQKRSWLERGLDNAEAVDRLLDIIDREKRKAVEDALKELGTRFRREFRKDRPGHAGCSAWLLMKGDDILSEMFPSAK